MDNFKAMNAEAFGVCLAENRDFGLLPLKVDIKFLGFSTQTQESVSFDSREVYTFNGTRYEKETVCSG